MYCNKYVAAVAFSALLQCEYTVSQKIALKLSAIFLFRLSLFPCNYAHPLEIYIHFLQVLADYLNILVKCHYLFYEYTNLFLMGAGTFPKVVRPERAP